MGEFEQWFSNQDFYTNMRFIHGDNLFSKDGDVYRVLSVQMTKKAWVEQQSKIEQLEKKSQRLQKQFKFLLDKNIRDESEHATLKLKLMEITRLAQSLRNEFDLNSDCPQVDRQIELLEKALRGDSCE